MDNSVQAQPRIAIIGAGAVGRALGAGLGAAGHTVVHGVRDPDDPEHADLAARDTPGRAASGADIVVLAIPADAVVSAIPGLGLSTGQVVVDATNAAFSPVPEGFTTMGELVTSLLPDGVAFVKAFNTIGAEHLGDGRFGSERAFLPIAGDADATGTVVRLATDLGFDPVVVGGRDTVGLLEDHARLWIHLAFRCGWGRSFGFGVLGR